MMRERMWLYFVQGHVILYPSWAIGVWVYHDLVLKEDGVKDRHHYNIGIVIQGGILLVLLPPVDLNI